MAKPTGGWKANAYVIFDYFSPTDFKFAGVDDSINKMVIGYRDASGWHVAAQGTVPGGVKAGTFYNLNVVVNGLVVTVTLDGKNAFSYTFAPRMIGTDQVALNRGLSGFGSNQAQGWFDNISLTVISPAITLDSTEYFEGSNLATVTAADRDGRSRGRVDSARTWHRDERLGIRSHRRSRPQPPSRSSTRSATSNSRRRFKAIGTSGFMFDWYSNTDYKFVATGCRGPACHHRPRGRREPRDRPGHRPHDHRRHRLHPEHRPEGQRRDRDLRRAGARVLHLQRATGDGRQGVFGLGSGTSPVFSIDDYHLKTDDAKYSTARRCAADRLDCRCRGHRGCRRHHQDRDHDRHPIVVRRVALDELGRSSPPWAAQRRPMAPTTPGRRAAS